MSSSPYSKTNFSPDGTLGILTIDRTHSDDALYTVEPEYQQLIVSYDLYKDLKLWWIFAQRNQT